ncbi:MAG TPA: nucleoside hydrolase [Rhodanobacteraceae bacterium]|nr:nucleoside hydrolase [Rhodanobacteraceae bacterium]
MLRPRLLIDTDPGIDDALAILMAHEHAEIVALTIAGGNVGLAHTTRNALKLLDAIDADVPVFPGSAAPLVFGAPHAAFVHGEDGFGDTGCFAPSRLPEEEHAAQAIVRLARERPGELTLVALAPLTNLALALRLDPSLPDRIARLVVMGGAATGRGNTDRVPAEFNIGFDPEAAHVVFSSWPMFDLVDWEACLRHPLDFERFETMLAGGDERARFYTAISRKARAFNRARGRPGVIAADALAMAVALDPAIVTASGTHHVAVETAGENTRGATVVDWEDRLGQPPNARVVVSVDAERFERRAAEALGAGRTPGTRPV